MRQDNSQFDFFWKPLSFKHNEEHKVYFCSDFHYGHDKEFMWGKSGFKSVLERDLFLKNLWQNKVSPNDTVFHLGDVMFGEGGEQRLESLLSELNFATCVLLGGNHFSGWKQLLRKHGLQWNLSENKRVFFVPNYLELYVNKQAITLCHFPQAVWNGMGKGVWHLNGHSHGTFNQSNMATAVGKQLDCGYESLGSLWPVSFDELKRFMDKQKIVQVDHHGAETSYAI